MKSTQWGFIYLSVLTGSNIKSPERHSFACAVFFVMLICFSLCIDIVSDMFVFFLCHPRPGELRHLSCCVIRPVNRVSHWLIIVGGKFVPHILRWQYHRGSFILSAPVKRSLGDRCISPSSAGGITLYSTESRCQLCMAIPSHSAAFIRL